MALNEICQAALDLQFVGYRVVPMVGYSKKPRGKQWQNRDMTRQDIISHWQKFPDDQLAVVPGSRGAVVIDADIYKSAETAELFAEICTEHDIDLSEEVTVKSASGGYHLWLGTTEYLPSKADTLGKNIDTRAFGGCAIVPPSCNADGIPYEWGPAGSLVDNPILNQAPASLVERLHRGSAKKEAVEIDAAPQSLPDWLLGMSPLSNGREEFMAKVVYHVGMEMARDKGNVDDKKEWANAAWDIYRPRVTERDGRTLDQDDRGMTMMVAKIHSTHTKIVGMLKAGEPLNDPDFAVEEKPVNTSPLPLEFWSELGDVEPPFDFVEGLLTDGEMSVVYGETNVGKTFFVMDLAAHVALGRSYMGRDVEQGAVVYVAAEGGGSIRKRIKAFAQKHEITDAPLAIIPAAVDLLSPTGDVDKIIEACEVVAAKYEMPVRLVVIDTLSRVMASGNENSPEAMTGTIATIDKIRFQTNAHTLVVHHSGKAKAQGARGHSSLPAATTTEIELNKINEGMSIAKIKKQRDLEIGNDIGFALDVVEVGIDARGKPLTSCVVRGVKIDQSEERPMTPTEKIVFDIFNNILIGDYRLPQAATLEFPGGANLRVSDHVRMDEIRPWFYRQCGHTSGQHADIENLDRAAKETMRKSLMRACNGLKTKGKISFDGKILALPSAIIR